MKILSNQKRGLLTLALMLATCATIMAKAIIPFGVLEQKPWEAKFYYATNASGDTPGDEWYSADFDDFSWGTITGPIAGGGLSYYNTTWDLANTTYWVRCHFNLTAEDLTKFLSFYIANDDTGEAYINGVQIYNVTSAANYSVIRLKDEAKAALKVGENVLAVKVRDNGSNRYMDFGLYASDFNDVVKRADVPVQFENDATHPWGVLGYNAVEQAWTVNGEKYASWLKMSYTSTERTELSFEWARYGRWLYLYIDGVKMAECNTDNYNNQRTKLVIEPGEHVIAFRDSTDNDRSNYWGGVRNIYVKEITQIGESSAMSANSQPLTFKNDVAAPWTIEDGYIEHRSWGVTNSSSSISTTFTVTKTSNFSFDYAFNPDRYVGSYTGNISGYHYMFVYLNGILLNSYNGAETYNTYNLTLEPGEYTVEIKDSTWRSEDYYLRLKNIKLNNNWVNVELATPGTLGYEVLYSPGIDVLADVEFLKVKGKMNDADWTDIKNMINLKALDLSEAIIDLVPNYAFDGKTLLGSVILPEGTVSIGEFAFRGTTIRRINIPASVTEIMPDAFRETPIMFVTFSEGSQLKKIGRYAFYSCKLLQEIYLPPLLEEIGYNCFTSCVLMKHVTMGDAVTTIGANAFRYNNALQSIRFSDSLEEIYTYMCQDALVLTDVHLPANLKRLDLCAFYNTPQLRNIEFPALLNQIEIEAFRYSGLESVKLPINLQVLGEHSFSNNSNLTYIEFPSYLSTADYYSHSDRGWNDYRINYDRRYAGYRNNFHACPNIETIVMRSATPPEVPADPFVNSRDKSVVTLVVPSFAVVNYKLDTYWKAFGSIIEGDDVDYWKITSPLMLTNNRRMQGTPDVDLYYNGQLTVGGAAPMTMDKFNMFFSEDNPGRLLNTCDAVSANEAATKFSVAANRWYFITPIHDVNIANIDVSEGASYVFRYYDAENRAVNGATGSWKNVDTSVLKGGQGYIFHCNKACVITFPADAEGQTQLFTTSDVTWNLTTNESTTPANRSWNYVGNPYPCYYDIYYMDFTAPITIWNGSTYKAYSIADDDLVLRPMQSFFVQKPEAVDKIVFNKEGRQLLSTVAPHTTSNSFTLGEQSRKIFNIQIADSESENAADETRVVLNNNANMGYELECDASKFMSLDNSVPQIFTTDSDGNAYAINERPALDGKVTLAFYAAKAGEYTISAQRADGKVQLIDSEEGNTIDITNESYTFGVDASSEANITRFTLVFSEKDATGTDEIKENINVNVNGDTYDLMGRKTNATQPGIYVQGNVKVIK